MEIVDVHAVFNGGHADFICSAIAESFLDARADWEHGRVAAHGAAPQQVILS
jgi:hypothetical protein